MHSNENIARAFETLQAAYCFDAFGKVPHPSSVKFREEAESWFMRRLGVQLVDIAEGEDLQWIGRTIQRYFRREQGRSEPVGEAPDVPRFLLQPGDRMEPRIDPAELAAQLTAATLAEQETVCIVTSQLGRLKQLLHLSDAETKWLKLAYACSARGRSVDDQSDNLHAALQYLGLRDESHRNRTLAALLDEPLAAIETMLRPPISMVALRFIDMACAGRQGNMLEVVTATDAFIELLEDMHRSDAAVVNRILEPEIDAHLIDEGDTPIGALYERFARPIAECYERAVLGRPLNMVHIKQIVERFTGYAALPTTYAPLAERITFEGIREAIKRATLDCRMANKPVTRHTLFKALYGATM